MIKITNLVKSYLVGNKEVTVLKDISLSVQDDEFAVVMGESGCGKSTFLGCISGLNDITSGEILLDDITLHDKLNKVMEDIRLTKFGFIFQDNYMINNLTILENVCMSRLQYDPNAYEKGKALLTAMHIDDNGESITVPYQITQVVHKIHLQDYSIENESTLLTLIQINSYGANYANFQPLYYQLQGDNTTQSIFKYLSYTLLAALIIGDFFVFYAFFNRKLDEDKNKLAMMILCGIKQKNIMKAYIRELCVQVFCTLLICGGLNALGYYVFQLHKQAYTAIFFDMTPVLLGITGLAILLIFC